MSNLETIMCCIVIPVAYALFYIAGKYDILAVVCGMLEESCKKYTINNHYRIITLCGSTKFKDAFMREQKRLTLDGNIVISVGLFGHSGDEEAWSCNGETKNMLDDMHKRKIDMSDGIFVINENGYIGESTKAEIRYALEHGKTIEFLEPIPADKGIIYDIQT